MFPLALFAGILLLTSLTALWGGRKVQNEAVYLVSRVALRHGFEVHCEPLSLVLPGPMLAPWDDPSTCQGLTASEDLASDPDGVVLHYDLLAPGRIRDTVVLRAQRPAPGRLGHLVIDNAPMRFVAAGLVRVSLGAPYDRAFRLFADPERHVLVRTLLDERGADFLGALEELARCKCAGHFELVDQDGWIKVQFDDRTLRFPSELERVTLSLVRLHAIYRDLAG